MPEGPEIRRAADRIAEAVSGKVAVEVSFGQPALRRHGKTLSGQRISGVETRGKAILTHFDNGYSIYSHNQLYGVWRIVNRGTVPQTRRSLRLAIHTEDKSALLFSASDISVWPTDELPLHPFLARIGPDLLSEEVSARDIRERLELINFRRRSFAALYLDQQFIAGIGNYLRSEMLWDAGIHPWARPADLPRSALTRLARSTHKLMHRAYETGGITNDAARVKRMKKAGEKRRDYRFSVFDRQSRPCYRCETPIVRTEVSSRRLYWCPGCQPE